MRPGLWVIAVVLLGGSVAAYFLWWRSATPAPDAGPPISGSAAPGTAIPRERPSPRRPMRPRPSAAEVPHATSFKQGVLLGSTLPAGYQALVPHPAGSTVAEARMVAEHTHWVALHWARRKPAAAAAFYRRGLTEKGWKVLTSPTAAVHAQMLARLGLATGAADEVVVGKQRGRTAAVLVSRDPGGAGSRIEVTLIRLPSARRR